MNPWAGLASYQDGDWRKFCGRGRESFDVAQLVDNNIFVTLYGKSGIGKTSLLNAGVFPRLRADGYLPVSIRLGIEAYDGSLQECILKKIRTAIDTAGTVTETDIVPMPLDETQENWLWCFFARNRFFDNSGQVLFPVLVFDQFEEVFRTRPQDTAVLLRQICFMMDRGHVLADTDSYRYDFNFRFLISIREDELYRLEDCIDENYLPEMKNCRYRLRGLSEKGALEVITVPGAPYIAPSDKDAIARTIINIARNKEDGTISSNILSLVCSRAYNEILFKGLDTIDFKLIEGMVAEDIFEKYYLEAVSGLPRKASAFIQEHLIDSSDRRNSVSEPDFFKAVPDGEVLIQDGPKKILQRVSVASGSNQTRIELVHDSFCEPIARIRKKHVNRRRIAIYSAFILTLLLVIAVSTSIIHTLKQKEWRMLESQSRSLAEIAIRLADEGDYIMAKRLAAAALPANLNNPKDRPYVLCAEVAFRKACSNNDVVLTGHTSFVSSVAISPDSKRIVSGAFDNTIRIWDMETGKHIGEPLTGHEGDIIVGVSSVAISPDGKRIVSGSSDCTIRIWELSIEDNLDYVRKNYPPLSEEEKRRYGL